MSLGSTGSKQAFQVDVVLLEEQGRLRIVVADGFEMTVPLDRVCGFGAETSGSHGIWLKIAAGIDDASGTYRLEFESTCHPNTSRDALLQLLNTEIGNHAVQSRFRRPAEQAGDDRPADSLTEPPPAANRVRRLEPAREAQPPQPLRGPALVADDEEWVTLWPLEDTVALSKGELLPPPGRA